MAMISSSGLSTFSVAIASLLAPLLALILLRFAVVLNGLAKEAQHNGSIPFGGQQEVDGMARNIHRAIQIFPLIFDLHPFAIGYPQNVYADERAYTVAAPSG